MKVLVVSHNFPLSRNEVSYSFVFDEAFRLASRGVEVDVVRGVYDADLAVDALRIHNLAKINLSAIPFGLRRLRNFPISSFLHPLESFYYLNYGQTVAEVVKAKKIDIIHAHFACPGGFVAGLAKRSVKKPLVVTLHGFDILTEPSINYGDRLQKDYDDKVRTVLSSADKVLVASKAVYDEALKAGCIRDNLTYVANGVDLNRFNPELDGESIRDKLGIKNRPIVFTLRAFVPKNGVEYLIKSAPEVLNVFPDAVFIIGGDGLLRPSLESLVNTLGLSQNVIFAGRIPYIDLPYFYSACDVFVIPSIVEAFGLVTVEAMACGKPVIGTNVGGIPDTIKNGINGYLVNPKDPKSLAEKIVFLLESPSLAKRMGKKGRRIAEENFDVEKRIGKILSIYSQLTK